MRVIVQDIGQQGHEDCIALSPFVDWNVAKYVTNEAWERMTVYGTVVQSSVAKSIWKWSSGKSTLWIIFDVQEHHDNIDVQTISEYVMNYHRVDWDYPHDGYSKCENPKKKHQ